VSAASHRSPAAGPYKHCCLTRHHRPWFTHRMGSKEDLRTHGDELRARRERLGADWTRARLARAVSCSREHRCSPSRIAQLELGYKRVPSISLAARLAWVYGHGCTVEDLIRPWCQPPMSVELLAPKAPSGRQFRSKTTPTQIGWLRRRRGRTQVELARAALISENTLARLERRSVAAHKPPRIATLASLAHALGEPHVGKLLIVEWTWWPGGYWTYPQRPDGHVRAPARPYPGYRPRDESAAYYDPWASKSSIDKGQTFDPDLLVWWRRTKGLQW
jgi:transcriptional regulator with XRE-family HTH domain